MKMREKMWGCILLALAVIAVPAWADVTVVNADGQAIVLSTSSFTLAGFDVSGSGKLVVVTSGEGRANVKPTVLSITYGGVDLTEAIAVRDGDLGLQYTTIWYLDDPTGVASSGDIVVTWNTLAGGAVSGSAIGALALSGAARGVPQVTTSNDVGTSVDITPLSDGSLTLVSFVANGGTVVDPVALTSLLNGDIGSAVGSVGYEAIAVAGPATYSYAYTQVGPGTPRPVTLAASFAPARGIAHDPVPDGSVDVDAGSVTSLTWMSPDNPNDPNLTSVTGYDVYFYGVLTGEVAADDPNFAGVSPVSVSSEAFPVSLSTDTTYFWRVDSHVTWDSNEITGNFSDTMQGFVWSFKTLLADNPPIVDAGTGVLTALELLPASVAGTVDDLGEGDLISVVWTVEAAPDGAVYSLPNGGTNEARTAMLTTDTAGDYTLRLTATDGTGPVWDEIVVTVAEDACAAAVASGLSKNVLDVAPAGGDCVVNLLDFAEMALDWLEDIRLTGQISQ